MSAPSKTPDHSEPVPGHELARWARRFVDGYLELTGVIPPPQVQLKCFESTVEYESGAPPTPAGPVASVREGRALTLYLDGERLQGVSFGALQGWMDRETGKFLVELRPDYTSFNFSRTVLPLFRVSGSGVNFLRHIIELIISALKEFDAAMMAVRLGHGEPQEFFRFHYLNDEPEDHETYSMIADHSWTRSVFVCKRLVEYLPLAALSSKNISFSTRMEEQWRRMNSDLLSEDQALISEVADLAMCAPEKPLPQRVVAVFEVVKTRLLESRPH